ncbi:MAG TPA: glycosyl hydrolase, partial [Bacteroidales bacterium]|nr:glycosyl hydrolase [Bacteroidales bacterium]
MKIYSRITVFLLMTLVIFSCSRGEIRSGDPWPEVTNTTRPYTRWWWMGNAVDTNNLGKLLDEYHNAGLGGVEITPIYGVKGYEDRYIDFLSPRWMDMLRYTTTKAKELKMQVDMNLGTGWPFGGPQITPGYAASKLIIRTFGVDATSPGKIKLFQDGTVKEKEYPKLMAVTACNGAGERLILTPKVDSAGILNWRPDNGKWPVYAAFE